MGNKLEDFRFENKSTGSTQFHCSECGIVFYFFAYPMQQKSKVPQIWLFFYDCCILLDINFTSKLVFPFLDTSSPISLLIVPVELF
jgi:hypothetical protein